MVNLGIDYDNMVLEGVKMKASSRELASLNCGASWKEGGKEKW